MRDSKGKFVKIYNDPPLKSVSIALPREQKLNCRFSLNQIEEMRSLYSEGNSSRWIAKQFNTGKNTILYWVKDEEFRKSEIARKRKYKQPYKAELQKKYRARLKKLIPNLALIERAKSNLTHL